MIHNLVWFDLVWSGFWKYNTLIYNKCCFIYRKLEEKIKCAEEEVNNNSEIYNKTKQEYSTNKDMHSTKIREWRSVQNRVKRLEDDIGTLCKEIHRLERLINIIFFAFIQCQFYITLLHIHIYFLVAIMQKKVKEMR